MQSSGDIMPAARPPDADFPLPTQGKFPPLMLCKHREAITESYNPVNSFAKYLDSRVINSAAVSGRGNSASSNSSQGFHNKGTYDPTRLSSRDTFDPWLSHFAYSGVAGNSSPKYYHANVK